MRYHLDHYTFKKRHLIHHKDESLRKFYWMRFFNDMGYYMVSIFILFFIYSLGYSLIICLLFILLGTICQPIFQSLGFRLIARLRIIRTAFLCNIVTIGFFITLSMLDSPSWLGYSMLFLACLLNACGNRLYAVIGDLYFSSVKHEDGKDTALIWIIGIISGAFAPLLGGLLGYYYNFSASLLIASIFILGSIIPLVFLKHHHHIIDFPKNMTKYLKFKTYFQELKPISTSNILAYCASATVARMIVPLWTLYIMIEIFSDNTYRDVGILIAISTIFSLLIVYIIGKLIDKNHQKLLIHTSTIIELLLGGFKLLATSISLVTIHNLISQQSAAHGMTLYSWYTDKNRSLEQKVALFSITEMMITVIHSIIIVLIIILMLAFPQVQLNIILFSSMAMSLFSLLLFRFSCNEKSAQSS